MNALAIVPVSALVRASQFFMCVPYKCTMAARSCVARQGTKHDQRTGDPRPKYPLCVGCKLGAEVRARVDGASDAPVAVVCAHDGCGREVVGAKPWMRPLCPQHRTSTRTEKPTMQTAVEKTPDIATDTTAVPTCPVKGCTEPARPARPGTHAEIAKLCARHRHDGANAVYAERVSADAIVAYLSEGKHKPIRGARKAVYVTAPGRCPVCGDSPSPSLADTHPALASMCRRDRKRAHDAISGDRTTAADAAEYLLSTHTRSRRPHDKPTIRAAAANVAPPPPPRAESTKPATGLLCAAMELIERRASLAESLGGIDAAERFAADVIALGGPAAVMRALNTLIGGSRA